MNHFWRFLCVLLLGLLTCGFGRAEDRPATAPGASSREWDAALTRAEKVIVRPDISDEALEGLDASLHALQTDARKAAEAAKPDITKIKDELAALGPPPTAEAPAEPQTVAERRKALSDRLALAEGAIKEAEVALARAEHTLEKVSALRRVRFTERITARGLSPLDPAVWRIAWPEFTELLQQAVRATRDWLQRENSLSRLLGKGWRIPAGVLVAVMLAWPLRLWLLRRFGYISLEGDPSYRQRLRAALLNGVVRSLLPSAAVIALYLSLRDSELLPDAVIPVLRTVVLSLIFVFFTAAFCWAALAPNAPSWRLAPLSNQAALSLSRVVSALAVVFAADWMFAAIGEQVESSLELLTLQQFVSGLAIAALLLALLRSRIWQTDATPAAGAQARRRLLRLFLALLVAAIPLSACLGYVALSRLFATQFVQTAGFLALLALFVELGGELIDHLLSPDCQSRLRLRESLELTDEGSQLLGFWLKAALRVLLLVTAMLTIPLLWGAKPETVASWWTSALDGFRVGTIRISLTDLFWATVLFAVLLLATRMVQRALDQQIFPRTRLDAGVRHSIRASIGYLGFTLAAVLAISSIGIDLSNLALIAGALSVGVGLGLQNIVSNFVSGIILLVERPIKTGDWVVIGEHQGYVKRISVRATELQTFDRGSVFIPNSNLVSGPVMNRTYADPQGRVIVPVGLAYGSDTQKVRRVLLGLAERNPDVLKYPAPTVLFRGFGESALQFELVAFIADVNRSLSVTSDLCFAIDEAFTAEDLRFPYPHRDVSLSLQPDQIEQMVAAWKAGAEGAQDPGPLGDGTGHGSTRAR
jgi:small-conductance mechanosensitive channel